MSNFEIITITLSFIVGIGVAQLLSSFAVAFRGRTEHSLHWMPFAWGVVILLFSIQYWFALLDLNKTLAGGWDWLWYGQMLILAVALFLAGALVLPSRVSFAKGDLLDDFVTHGRYSLLALAAYLLGWIPANMRMNNGEPLHEAYLSNIALAILALIAFKSRSSRVWLTTTVLFYLLFALTLLSIYSTPG